ncbi:MAG: hypothetical protein ACR2JE_08165 [Acidobacteriaceae bacterium]
MGPALLLLACLTPLACSRSGPNQSGGGTPGASAAQQHSKKAAGGANAGANPNSTGKAQSNFSEPASSVSGTPSTASDNGSPSAVAGRSIAEPGAPEGTLNGKKAGHAPAAAPAAPRP